MTAPPSLRLGQTKDKTQLVPGRVSTVTSNVDDLGDEATKITERWHNFRSANRVEWTGGASAAYQLKAETESDKWETYIGLLKQAKGALSTYATALGSAQDKAQNAIDKWEEGEQATRAAETTYNAQVATYNRNLLKVASPFTPLAAPSSPPGPFVDPGQTLRDDAQQILHEAREGLDKAGNVALDALGAPEDAGGSKNSHSGNLDALGSTGKLTGPKFNWNAWQKTFGSNEDEDSPFEINLGKAQGEVYVFNAKGKFVNYYGDVKVNGNGSVTLFGADGSVEAKIDKEGVKIGVEGDIEITGARGTIHGHLGPADAQVGGLAVIGAVGKGGLEIGTHGVHADGEVFAGAKAGLSGKLDVGGVGAQTAAEVSAGLGVSGEADATIHNGKIHIQGSAGLTLLVGGKVTGGLTIDIPKVIDTGEDVVGAVGDFVGGLGG